MQLNQKHVLAIKRKRGELNLNIANLAKQVGVSRYTMTRVINHSDDNFTSTTVKKLNNWLIDQYTADDKAELAEVVQDNQQTVKG
ncbi:XRE family transcriptional regulator [Lactobacillus sp. PSON]|uniref:XRE family transcriptional regulator n=1 Tax=Lactobacillus sp. PSON TaxID=3455454 RepID=UPI00404298EC